MSLPLLHHISLFGWLSTTLCFIRPIHSIPPRHHPCPRRSMWKYHPSQAFLLLICAPPLPVSFLVFDLDSFYTISFRVFRIQVNLPICTVSPLMWSFCLAPPLCKLFRHCSIRQILPLTDLRLFSLWLLRRRVLFCTISIAMVACTKPHIS